MMIRFGAHAFTWEAEWNRESAERVFHGASEAGLDLVEIPLLNPAIFDAAHVKELMRRYSLAVAFSLGLPVESRLPDYPDKAEKFLFRVLEIAHEVGAGLVSGVLYGTLGELPRHRPEQREYEIIAGSLRKIALRAAELGIEIGLEPVNRYETYLLNTVEQTLSLIDMIDMGNVVVHLDTYHSNIEEKGFFRPIYMAGEKLRYIHLSESDRGTPGQGTVDWDQVFSALRAVNFKGDLVMESFVALHPDIAMATCLWRDVAPDSRTLVSDGLSFLRKKAEDYLLI